MPATMVYDIETVPDIEGGRKLLGLFEANDAEVREALVARRCEQTQGTSEFLQHYLHRIVAISVVVRTDQWVKVWSLGELESTEKELISRFFQGVERYLPTMVSWNGSGFDLPVLHYRSLIQGVAAPQYWEVGDNDPTFKWNNYLGRYHQRHTDLMEVLAGYQSRAYAPLDEIAKLLGFPGKMGMEGGAVWQKYEESNLQSIRDYCETDVLNTYLIYLRFQYIKGHLDKEGLSFEEERLKEHLKMSHKSHLLEFLGAWHS
jgi:predicted PolB exonuclease-like 3'-5' exonuclease